VVHDTEDVPVLLRDMPRREPLAGDALSQRARELAATHRASTHVHRRQQLLKRLVEGNLALDAVRRGLSEAVELEQRITPSAEWLLDNAYIIQGHIADIRTNLPRRYDKDLPVLIDNPNSQSLRSTFWQKQSCTDARLNHPTLRIFSPPIRPLLR
jgi:hypothetical protein